MALFALLVVLWCERLRLFARHCILEREFERYRLWMFAGKAEQHPWHFTLALLLPAVVVGAMQYVTAAYLFGVLNLLLWLAVGLLLFGLRPLRDKFRHYLNAGRRGDLQACLLHARSLDETQSIEVDDGVELGLKMGQLSAWVNYRFYVAVFLYFLLLGPAAATLYVTVRAYHDYLLGKAAGPLAATEPLASPASTATSTATELVLVEQANELPDHTEQSLAWAQQTMWALDWLPARIVAIAYALSGHFSRAAPVLVSQLLDWRAEPRQIIMQVAAKAEDIPTGDDSLVSLQPTLALFKLAKRTFILLLVMASLLTVFGVIH